MCLTACSNVPDPSGPMQISNADGITPTPLCVLCCVVLRRVCHVCCVACRLCRRSIRGGRWRFCREPSVCGGTVWVHDIHGTWPRGPLIGRGGRDVQRQRCWTMYRE